MKVHKDLTGERFTRLYVVRCAGKDSRNHYLWECQCDCGNIKILPTGSLTSGRTKSCGCYNKEVAKRLLTTHGMTNSRLYQTWCGIKARCFNPSMDNYYLYGGRGITICDEWKNSFESFMKWAFANGYTDDLTIERNDPNGNYEPSNCRWATAIEQANNKRCNHRVTYKGETRTLAEWSRSLNVSYNVLTQRLRRKWSVERAFETPVGADKWHKCDDTTRQG